MSHEAAKTQPPGTYSPAANLGYDLYRDLYFSERQRREAVRGSIAVPTAALAFSIYSLGMLATRFDATRWSEPSALALGLLALVAAALLVAGAVNIGRVEWMFVYHDPPDLEALVEGEERVRDKLGRSWSENGEGERQMRGLLTGSFYIAYEKYFSANEKGAHRRTVALRLVLAALVAIALAFALLPVHLAGR